MKKNIGRIIQNDLFLSSILIIGLAAIAYLPFVGSLGYYRDDWYAIWASTTQGLSTLIKMFSIDRPFMGFVYAITSKILGGNLLGWHLFAFMLRITCSLIFFWIVRMLWPKQIVPGLLMTLIFTIYPGFLQQTNANTFQNLFIGYGFCLLSIALNIRAFFCEKKSQRIMLTIISILTGLFYLLILEYLIGMEFLRICLLYILVKKDEPNLQNIKVALRIFILWLPYLLLIFVFIFWRLVIFTGARSTTDIGILSALYLQNPAGMLLKLLRESELGVINTVLLSWAVPLYNLIGNLSSIEFVLGLTLSFLVGLCVFYILSKNLKTNENNNWQSQAIVIGILSVIGTILPIVLSNRSVRLDNVFNRYTYQSSFGIAVFTVGLISSAVHDKKIQLVVFSILIGSAILTHYANNIYYKNFWDMERELWWQLSWRAPRIKDDTTLVVFMPNTYRFAESYEIWAPANIIYNPNPGPLKITAEVPNKETLPMMIYGKTVGRQLRRVEYTIDFKQMLVLSMPGSGACMHAIDGNRPELSGFEEPAVRSIYPFSRISLIDTTSEGHQPPASIFGKEIPHDWCYYFQKASLARQKGDWKEVIRLGEIVMKLDLYPKDLSEWMPFYEGFAKGNRVDLANEVGALIRHDQTFVWQFCNEYKNIDWTQKDKIDAYIVTNICGI